MATKTIHSILQLKDKFSQPIIKSKNNTKQFQRQVKKTKNSIKKFKTNASKDFKSVAKSAIGLAGAYVGFKAIASGISECVEMAKAQIEVETKLAAVFKATGKATKDQVEELKSHAESIEKVGVVGADVSMAFQQQLATYNLTADSVKSLSGGAGDLIAQMKGLNSAQGDGINVGNMFGKVLSGQLGALSRAGITFNEAQEEMLRYGTESEKVATLVEVLEQNVGGVNKALAQTDDGKILQAKNRWDEYKEMLGGKVLAAQAKFAEWFVKYIPNIEKIMLALFENARKGAEYLIPKFRSVLEWIKKAFGSVYVQEFIELLKILKGKAAEAFNSKHTKTFLKALQKIKETLVKLLKVFYKVTKYFIKNWKKFEPIIIGIMAAFAAYNAILLTAKVRTIALAAKQLVLSAAMSANPIGLVCIAIAALVAIGVTLYRNWDTIKLKMSELWDNFNIFIGNIKEKFPVIGVIIDNVIGTVKAIIDGLKTTISGIVGFITGVFTGDWEKAWQGIKDIFSGVFNTFEAIAKAPLNGIIGLMNLLIDKINGFEIDVPGWVTDLTGIKDFGFNIPSIPKLALGSPYTTGGTYEINDGTHGGEIVNLPNGSQVIPADRSKEMVKGAGGVTVYVEIKGNVIGNDQFADEVGNKIVKKVVATLNNM